MNSNRSNPLGTEPIPKLLTRFAIPSIIAMLVSALYNMVDQFFIGHSVGMLGNAATNVAFPLTTTCTAIALLFGIGGAANFNLCMGRGQREDAQRYLGTAVSMLVLCGTVLCLTVKLFLEPLICAFGATADVLEYALTYTGITAFGFPFVILSTGGCHLIRADGSPKYSMLCMLTGALVNTILDPLFIFVFDWGIAGAAWATVIGQLLSGSLAAWRLVHFQTVPMTRQILRPHLRDCLQTVSLGMAPCFNQLAMMVVQIAMNNVMTIYGAQSSYGSEVPLACSGIIAKVSMIFFSLVIGISQGLQPITSFNFGARQYKRVRESFWLALGAGTACCTVAFLIFQLFPRQIIALFGSGNEEYFAFAQRYFRIYLFCTFLNAVQPISSNFFTSIGKAKLGVFLSLTRQIIFLLPLILILPVFLGIDGVMYGGPIADLAASLLAGMLIFREMSALHQLETAQASHPITDD